MLFMRIILLAALLWGQHLAADCTSNFMGKRIEVDRLQRFHGPGVTSAIFRGRLEGREVFVKVPYAQERIEYLDDLYKNVTGVLGDLAVDYYGIVEITVGNQKVKGLVLASLPGGFSQLILASTYFNGRTVEQLQRAMDLLKEKDIIPLDLQFFVTKDGSIKLLDFDLYVTPRTVALNPRMIFGRPESMLELANMFRAHFSQIRVHEKTDPNFKAALEPLERETRTRIDTLLNASGYEPASYPFLKMQTPDWAQEQKASVLTSLFLRLVNFGKAFPPSVIRIKP